MTTLGSMAVVLEEHEAYNAHDLDRYMHGFAPDAVISDGEGQTMSDGADAIRTDIGWVFENQPGATFRCGGGTFLEIYPSAFAGTAKSTVAGFQVADLEGTIQELRWRGVVFEECESPKTIEGIAHLGPNRGAWFKDPSDRRPQSAGRGWSGRGTPG